MSTLSSPLECNVNVGAQVGCRRPPVDQDADHLQVTFSCRKWQRSIASIKRVRSAIKKQAHHFRMVMVHCHKEIVPIIFHSPLQQEAHNLCVSSVHRRPEYRAASLDICAALHKQTHQLHVTVSRSQPQTIGIKHRSRVQQNAH